MWKRTSGTIARWRVRFTAASTPAADITRSTRIEIRMDALLWTARQPPQTGMRDWLATWLIMGAGAMTHHRDDKGTPDVAELTPVVYRELRQIAAAYLRRERPGQTLQATALVHEAYLRLAVARRTAFRRHRRSFDAPDPGGPGTGARRSEAMGGTGPRHAVGVPGGGY